MIMSIAPDNIARLTIKELLLLLLFVGTTAFTVGGAWIKLSIHEENGHPNYTTDIQDIKNRLIRIETLLKDK